MALTLRTRLLLLALSLCLLSLLPLGASAQEEKEGGAIYVVEVRAVDVDGEGVSGVLVEAYNISLVGIRKEIFLNYSTTNATGWAKLYWRGPAEEAFFNITFRAYWKAAFVGSLENVSITGNTTVWEPISCSICDLNIKVVDEGGRPLARVEISITATYTDRNNETASFTEQLKTNASGLCTLTNALMNSTYRISATRHNMLFNRTTLWRLNATTLLEITCPTYTALVSVVDDRMRPIRNAVVEAYDWGTGELMASQPVDENGVARLRLTLGIYKVKALVEGEVLAEGELPLGGNMTWFFLVCKFTRFNLTVRVVDALGNPLPNLLVQLVREGEVIANATTNGNGTVFFYNIPPGDIQVVIYAGEEILAIRSFRLDSSLTVEVRVEDRILFSGRPTRISDIVAPAVSGATVLLVALLVLAWPRASRRKTL